MVRVVRLWFALALLGACTSAAAPSATGTEGADCYPNGTCNQGLVCASRRCVVLPTPDGSVTDGALDTSAPDDVIVADRPVTQPDVQSNPDATPSPDVMVVPDSGARCDPACAADEVCTATGCMTTSTGGEGPINGGAVDEDPGGGGTTSCDAPTTAQVIAGVWWLPQSPPGSWGGTVNCGQTSLTMVNAFLARTTPTSANITAVDDWIQSVGLGATNSGNGSVTTVTLLNRVAREMFGYDTQILTGSSLSVLYDNLRRGQPVIVNVPNQAWICASAADCVECPTLWPAYMRAGGSATVPACCFSSSPGCGPTVVCPGLCRNPNPFRASCSNDHCDVPTTPPVCPPGHTCVSRLHQRAFDHFVVAVGIDDRFVYVNDPGRSEGFRMNVQYRPYERASFCAGWNGAGLVISRCTAGTTRSCTEGTRAGTQTCGSAGTYGACVVAGSTCDASTCSGHGTCSAGVCTCSPGFAGPSCNTCAPGYISYPTCSASTSCPAGCSGHGTCDMSRGACTCATGFTGAACDACASGYYNYPTCSAARTCPSSCSGHGTCDPATGTCSCTIGFTGTACNACAPGYNSYPTCSATVPCPGGCSGHGTCDMARGTCVCSTGFAGAACDTCAAGYYTYPTCSAARTCPSSCSGHGTCDPATGTCSCATGFTGAACDACVSGYYNYPTCSAARTCPSSCSGHGTCDPATGTCSCTTGFTGTACNACATGYISYPTCSATVPCPGSCSTHGTCDMARGTCACTTGFAGAACDTCAAGYYNYPTCSAGRTCPSSCSGHGMCDPATGTCSCATGFTGSACDACASGYFGYPACSAGVACPGGCSSHGTCDMSSGTCSCSGSYTGAACDACASGYGPYPSCPALCGNGTCDSGESCSSCRSDCARTEIADYADNDCDGVIDNGVRLRLRRVFYSNGYGCTAAAVDWDHCFSSSSSGYTCTGSGQGTLTQDDPGHDIYVYPPSLSSATTTYVGPYLLSRLDSCYNATVHEHRYAIPGSGAYPSGGAWSCSAIGFVKTGSLIGDGVNVLIYEHFLNMGSDYFYSSDPTEGSGGACSFSHAPAWFAWTR